MISVGLHWYAEKMRLECRIRSSGRKHSKARLRTVPSLACMMCKEGHRE